ncbi:tripartite tricarboxylate transporter substrate binding protein [Alcaligenaceae bacterium]|nr:tripartite tricarboxylate transporter substrate binding protein [Alcaligenaceae bacterium]
MRISQLLRPLVAATLFCAAVAAHAQVSVMLPANPGGGWDSTGRQAMKAMNDAGIFTGTVSFTNKGGAGGTIGLADFQRSQKGKSDALAVFGAITVGSITMNKSPVDLSKFKPMARLTAEYLVLAVKADAPYQNVDEFVAALKANPGATAVGGGSAGGVDHIALALLAQNADVPVSSLNYIPQAGGADTVTGIVNGTLKAGISGVSEFQQFADTGRIRILAVSADKRMEGLEHVPTFKEAGYDVALANWRGVLGSVDMPEENYQQWLDRFTKLSESPEWHATMERQGWEPYFLSGEAFGEFMASESKRINAILQDAGLVK